MDGGEVEAGFEDGLTGDLLPETGVEPYLRGISSRVFHGLFLAASALSRVIYNQE